MSSKRLRLWSDEPSPVDLLAFGAVAETAVEAVLDDALDPIAIGISGPWGSGKSTVLKLIQAELASRSVTATLHHLLSTLHDGRCRTPCKTRFRLAGCAFAGRGSNPLDRYKRFQIMSSSSPGLTLAQ